MPEESATGRIDAEARRIGTRLAGLSPERAEAAATAVRPVLQQLADLTTDVETPGTRPGDRPSVPALPASALADQLAVLVADLRTVTAGLPPGSAVGPPGVARPVEEVLEAAADALTALRREL